VWPTGAEGRQIAFRGGAMLYDASRAGNAAASWFDAGWWSRRGEVRASAEGRGAALFIQADGRHLVVPPCRPGGLIPQWVGHSFPWQSGEQTRSFIEWHMLYVM